MNEKSYLKKAIRQANLSPLQANMATILFAINGLDNAIKFIDGSATTPGLTGENQIKEVIRDE